MPEHMLVCVFPVFCMHRTGTVRVFRERSRQLFRFACAAVPHDCIYLHVCSLLTHNALCTAGTEVAKEAADIVILDDNFSSIVK
jgi:hypothetical protein